MAYKILNLSREEFENKFWDKVQETGKLLIEQKLENNFYVFYKRGEPIYINASNEYDMLFKLHKNTKIFIDDMPIYYEIMDWKDKPTWMTTRPKKWDFETENEMYEYYVEEILGILRIYDYHFEKLEIIK